MSAVPVVEAEHLVLTTTWGMASYKVGAAERRLDGHLRAAVEDFIGIGADITRPRGWGHRRTTLRQFEWSRPTWSIHTDRRVGLVVLTFEMPELTLLKQVRTGLLTYEFVERPDTERQQRFVDVLDSAVEAAGLGAPLYSYWHTEATEDQ